MLGHSSTQIVPRYAPVLSQNRFDAMKKLESCARPFQREPHRFVPYRTDQEAVRNRNRLAGRLGSLDRALVMRDVLKRGNHAADTSGQKCERPGRNNLSGSHAFRLYHEELALLAEGDDAEGPTTVVIVAGGEKELIGVAVGASHAALAELNGPDIVDFDGFPTSVAERA
jgi:hypothetical protein